jgi:photosystem II stability/assembly factor-like uncharacterized protein
MKKLLAALFLLMLAAGSAHAQWMRLDLPSGNYRDIFFPAEKTGFLVGDSGMVLKTVDDGVTWRKIEVGIKSNLKSVHFPSAKVGYIVGDSTFLKTVDGGENWTVIKASMYSGYKDVVFTTEEIGYLGSGYLRTSDGGKTWNKQKLDFCRDAYFINPKVGYILSEDYLSKTIDSGVTWSYVNYVYFGSSAAPNCGFFYDELNGCIGGILLGSIAYTQNGGQTWQPAKITSAYVAGLVSDIYFPSKDIGYAIGYVQTGKNGKHGVLKTKDGGKNWIGLEIDTSVFWSADNSSQVYFTDENTGYLVNGVVLKTTNGGEEPVSIQEPILKTISPNISPNPFKNSARIELPANLLKPQIRIFTAAGEDCSDCFKNEFVGNSVFVERKNASAGMYYYTIESEEKTVAEGKFIVE